MIRSGIVIAYFNCTIQELKLGNKQESSRGHNKFQLHHTGIKTQSKKSSTTLRGYFNCTIQELKRAKGDAPAGIFHGFQLHHTGIKTTPAQLETLKNYVFQLHHTGIKTGEGELYLFAFAHFNCTIQELKPRMRVMVLEGNIISIAPYRN